MIPNSTPTPRYEMRRRLARRVLRSYEPGRFLEAGCGWGELLPTLVGLGYRGTAIEPGDDSRAIALTRTASVRGRVDVVPALEDVEGEFDYVLAFEVLEHIENDAQEFQRWISLLRPGGVSMISVPAHEDRWSPSDTAVGHYRRYSAGSLRLLHSSVGMEVLELWSYGFPVTALTRRLRRCESVNEGHPDSMLDRTLSSASVSHSGLGRAGSLFSAVARGVGWLADAMQRPFLRTDLGDGYFVIARKKH